jgi:hypothetical protein
MIICNEKKASKSNVVDKITECYFSNFIHNQIMGDEPYFHLNGFGNKQN